MESREDCLHEATECDRLAELAKTQATRALLTVAAFQWRKLAEKAAERQKTQCPLRRKRYVPTSAQAEPGKALKHTSESDFDSAGQRQRRAGVGVPKRMQQTLQPSRSAMDTLA